MNVLIYIVERIFSFNRLYLRISCCCCCYMYIFSSILGEKKRNKKGPHPSESQVTMSLVLRKPAFCICENKDADQLRVNREADQRLCFRYSDSTIPLLLKSEISSPSHLLWLYSLVCVGPGRKPRRPVFSQRGSYVSVVFEGAGLYIGL